MKRGDLIKIIGDDDPFRFAIVLEVRSVGPDGPSMDSYASVMVDDKVITVWLYQCEVVGERSDD